MSSSLMRITCLTPLLALAASLGAQAAPLDTAALERALLDEMRDTHTPGVSIAVVAGERVVYAKGFGVASVETGELVTAATLFRIGSTTKMFTGLTAALLAREGKLVLGAPIGGVARGLRPPLASLTLDQLLSHRGGMVNEAAGNGRHDDAALGERVRGWGAAKTFTAAGDVYSYSGPGYWLAGYAIEQAAGVPFADAVEQRVLRPLGMARSTFRPLAAMTYPMAQDHRVGADGRAQVIRPFTDDVTTWASGSLFSNAEELARYAVALMNDGRLDGAQRVPPEAVAAMRTAHAPLPGAEGCWYSYGLSSCPHRGVRTLGHFGFRNGSGSVVTMVPEARVAVIILANRGGGIFARTAERALELLLPGLAPDTSTEPPLRAPTAAERARLAGTYVNGPDTLRVGAAPGDSLLTYRYGAERYPARVRGNLELIVLGESGEPVQGFALVTGASGRITYLHDGLGAFRKLKRD